MGLSMDSGVCVIERQGEGKWKSQNLILKRVDFLPRSLKIVREDWCFSLMFGKKVSLMLLVECFIVGNLRRDGLFDVSSY